MLHPFPDLVSSLSNPNAWLGMADLAVAFGLLTFAGMQWWVTHKTEQTRIDERERDRQERVDGAYAMVWAEYNRIWAQSEHLKDGDLVAAIYGGLLVPEDVLPRDWPGSTRALGELGLEAAQFGAVAYTVLHNAALMIRNMGQVFEQRREVLAPADFTLDMLTPAEQNRLRTAETQIRESLEEAANLLLDALDHAPGATAPRERRYNESLHSKHAKALVAELKKRDGGEPSN